MEINHFPLLPATTRLPAQRRDSADGVPAQREPITAPAEQRVGEVLAAAPTGYEELRRTRTVRPGEPPPQREGSDTTRAFREQPVPTGVQRALDSYQQNQTADEIELMPRLDIKV